MKFSSEYFIGFSTTSGTKFFVNVKSKRNRYLGLSLYQPYSIKGKVAAAAIKYLNAKVLKLLFKSEFRIPDTLKALHSDGVINIENASFMESSMGSKVVIVSRVDSHRLIVKLSKNVQLVENEVLARQSLQDKLLVPRLINDGVVLGERYISFDYIDGVSSKVDFKDIAHFIESLKRRDEYILFEHPKVRKIMLDLLEIKCPLNPSFEYNISTSKVRAKLVFEHGDFTPWNVKTDFNGNLHLFDWESWDSCGLEYFDHIHFLFTNYVFLKGDLSRFTSCINEQNIPKLIVDLYLLNRLYILKTNNEKTNKIIFDHLFHKSVLNAY